MNNLIYPSPKDDLCQVWLKLAHCGSGEYFFEIFNFFLLFCNYLPFKRAELFIWTNLSPLHPKILCAKFDWNWLSGSRDEFSNLLMYFCFFLIISPWNRMGPSFEQPFHQKLLCAKFLEIGPVVLEKKINIYQYIFTILQLSPLGKRRGPLAQVS